MYTTCIQLAMISSVTLLTLFSPRSVSCVATEHECVAKNILSLIGVDYCGKHSFAALFLFPLSLRCLPCSKLGLCQKEEMHGWFLAPVLFRWVGSLTDFVCCLLNGWRKCTHFANIFVIQIRILL